MGNLVAKKIEGLKVTNDELRFHKDYQPLILTHYITFPHKYEGLKLWEGGIVLLRYLLKNSENFKNKKTMDLGAGMGIVGIGMAKYLNCEVVMTDYIKEVLTICEENTFKNEPYQHFPKVEKLDWNDHKNLKEQKYDLIIGCELVYSITDCDNLVDLIKKMVKKDSKMLMIIPTCRAYGPEFLNKLAAIGTFKIHEEILDDPYYLEDPSGDKKMFYPLQELTFKMLEITFSEVK